MIAVDTHVVAYLYLPGPFSAAAAALLESDPEWRAPALWRSEFRNLMAGYGRRGEISWRSLNQIIARAESLMHDGTVDVESASVVDLVRSSHCSSYDCEFVAVALALDVSLVTMDKKVLRAFPGCAVPLTT